VRQHLARRLTALVAVGIGVAAALVFPANAAVAQPNCPHLTNSSCPTPPPKPSPPPCDIDAQNPYAYNGFVYANAFIDCDGRALSITLVVDLYYQPRPSPVASDWITVPLVSHSAVSAGTRCSTSGKYFGRAQAIVTWGYGYNPPSRQYARSSELVTISC
jgi:hypothetical protein